MIVHTRYGNAAATLCAALLLGVPREAANAPLLAAPPNPAQSSAARITQGARTFVPGGSVVPLPADLVSTVMVSYDQGGTHPISPAGSTSGTYKASTAYPGWVHVTVRNMGLATAPDGIPQPASFAVLVRFIYTRYVSGFPTGHLTNEVKEFPFTEPLKGGGTYKYDFFFNPQSNKITTGVGPGNISVWYPLTIEVKVDAPHQIRESNEANNDFTYVVHFTD